MHNTLKPFYNYLAQKLDQFFSTDYNLRAGDRYNLYVENDHGVSDLYEALKVDDSLSIHPFDYQYDSFNNALNTYLIRYGEIKLVVVSDKIATEHFITLLRNNVANQKEQFQNTAILILINKELDSLSDGSESLTKKGMPLNFDTFASSLKAEISQSGFTKAKRIVLAELLKKRIQENVNEASSIFDLMPIVNAITNESFSINDFPSLELFPHEELDTIGDEKKIRDLVSRNYDWFEKIQLSIQYGDLEGDLESDIAPAGIKEIITNLEDEKYKNIDFSKVLKWSDRKSNKPITLLGLETSPSLGIELWKTFDGKTKSQTRKQNLVFFNPSGIFPIELNIQFDNSFASLKTTDSKGVTEVKTLRKQIECLINDFTYNENFLKIECSDPNIKSNKFIFKIWVLPFSSEILHDFQDRYIINLKTGSLSFIAENKIIINKSKETDAEYPLKVNDSDNLLIDDNTRYELRLNEEEEQHLIPFSIIYKDTEIKLEWINQIPDIKNITGWDIWQKKRINAKNFKFEKDEDTIKLYHGGETFTVRDEIRSNLLLEEKMMDLIGHSWIQKENRNIIAENLSAFLPNSLIDSFEDFYKYFKRQKQLPSLTWLNKDGIAKAKKYITEFTKELNNLNNGDAVDESKSLSLFKLGTVIEDFEERRIKFSPLNPLVLMYQLTLTNEIGANQLYSSILKKLVPGNLLPFFNWPASGNSDKTIIYAAKDNDHSPEWQYYSKDYKFKQLASKSYIRKLIKTKLLDFTKHLRFLFNYNPVTPIKINAVNLGDCKQVLQGIFDYYKDVLNKGIDISGLRPIEVYIYGSGNHVTKFEEFSHYENSELIKEHFDIDFKSAKHDVKELINHFRRRVHYYICDDIKYSQYAHITFFQFDSTQVGCCDLSMDKLPSGKSLGGLITDIPSFFDNTAYKTGFGIKFDNTKNTLSEVLTKYNALARIIGTTNPFNENLAIGTSIKKEVRNDLNGLYNHSQWVTFIDPRFDLSFFKDESSLVIIHYSDQFSNASGYDAITVTQKSDQYKSVLNDFLERHNISKEHIDQDIECLIDLFNAINGEWLLGILSERKNEFVKNEKISLISAIKIFMAIHDRPDIVWVPISLEEILRVSGGAGFSSSEGLFSAKNLGAKGIHSDDILMVGLFMENEDLKICLYPLEVKIGNISNSVENKAREQALKTTKLLIKHLFPSEDSFINKLYRSFFAKLCIINADKLNLYGIWPEKKWEIVTEEYREKLLNDDFSLSNHLKSLLGSCGNMFFSRDETGVMERKLQMEDSEILSMTLFESDAYDFVLNSIPLITAKLVKTQNTLNKSLMLSSNDFTKESNGTASIEISLHEATNASDNNHEVEKPAVSGNGQEVKKELTTRIIKEEPSLEFNKITVEEKRSYYRSLLEKFKALNIDMHQKHIDEVEFVEGPAFFRMALYPAPRTTQNKIESILKEINLVLGLSYEQSVRIFQDRGTIWLEVPKTLEQCVTVTTEHIWNKFSLNSDFEIPFGMDISGNVISVDFSSSNSPHLLMAGTTGSGKSVVLDTLIRSAAKFYSPAELNMFLIDPKGNELIDFEDLPHVTEENGETSEDAIALLSRGVQEMQRRYQLFKKQKSTVGKAAKNIDDYNYNSKEQLPRWIIVLDEYADLIEENADNKREIESLLKRLSQKARAAGIHVILATQKPLASIVSSSIKANLPGVLALKVKTANDSRVVLDESGAETLAGYGDALFKNGAGKVVRVQCAIHLN